MDNNQNNMVSFKLALLNAEVGEKLGKIKSLCDFLANSAVYIIQNCYGTKSYNQEEYNQILDKYNQMKDIMDGCINLFEEDLKNKNISN